VNIGYRDTSGMPADDLRGRMSMSPSGRQIATDGNFVFPIVPFDPATARSNATEIYPDGSPVIYVRAGVQEMWTFTRATGWEQV
jgi:hypothetical protein